MRFGDAPPEVLWTSLGIRQMLTGSQQQICQLQEGLDAGRPALGGLQRPASGLSMEPRVSRQAIRQMKRSVVAGSRQDARAQAVALARESALLLLARSVAFGHRRLAVLRLTMAVRAGADIPQQHWAHCREAASTSADADLRAKFLRAEQAAASPPTCPRTQAVSTGSH